MNIDREVVSLKLSSATCYLSSAKESLYCLNTEEDVSEFLFLIRSCLENLLVANYLLINEDESNFNIEQSDFASIFQKCVEDEDFLENMKKSELNEISSTISSILSVDTGYVGVVRSAEYLELCKRLVEESMIRFNESSN